MCPPSVETTNEIRRVHAQQLAGLGIGAPLSAPEGPTQPKDGDDMPPLTPNQLLPVILGWINDNRAAVDAATNAQATSPSPDAPNWDTIFVALVESIAMYLRKDEEVAQAIISARKGDQAAAIAHLEASERLIQEVAKALDCTFVQLCDFADLTPDGLYLSSGAYAGLWLTNHAEKPFAGGSSSKKRMDRHKLGPLHPSPSGIAWGSQVHRGFYYNIFGNFTVEGKVQVPFDVLVEQLKNANLGQTKIHITGHSLGGGLCSLAYGEFLRRQSEPSFAGFNIGDAYSFAAPRICYEPSLMPPPPPPLVEDVTQYPFVHVGGAWKITPTGPIKMADEPPCLPPPSLGQMVTKTMTLAATTPAGRRRLIPETKQSTPGPVKLCGKTDEK
ncbi:hypothetical protein BC628DRAFT_1417727 [Trametes gibbosa]|nr:hypothetical protein BC628DRAFT_1417727 [Trametes gibbosa]